jgi:hypothetical protein
MGFLSRLACESVRYVREHGNSASWRKNKNKTSKVKISSSIKHVSDYIIISSYSPAPWKKTYIPRQLHIDPKHKTQQLQYPCVFAPGFFVRRLPSESVLYSKAGLPVLVNTGMVTDPGCVDMG